jgi:hypothetical protein
MQSLFIVSLPRTFSTQVFQIASRALALQQPAWVTDGEILNVDRYCHYHGMRYDECAKYTTDEHDPILFAQLLDLLDQVTVPEGFIYKDVIQPFVLTQWRGLRNFRVLKIQRDVAAVASSMLYRDWFYPNSAAAAPRAMPHLLAFVRRNIAHKYGRHIHAQYRRYYESTLLEGLMRAERALHSIPGTVIANDDVVHDENVLRNALASLYPDVALAPFRYIDAAFIAYRTALLKQRETARYKNLCARVERWLAKLDAA